MRAFQCECYDAADGHARQDGSSRCIAEAPAMAVLYRVDMDDQTGTVMCDACADDAAESGLFTTADEDDEDADDDGADTDDCARSFGPHHRHNARCGAVR